MFWYWEYGPETLISPTYLTWSVKQTMANRARIGLLWTPSVSTDVDHQVLMVTKVADPEQILVNKKVAPQVEEWEFTGDLGDQIKVSLVAVDVHGNESTPATLEFEIPDTVAPEAPTELRWELREILPDA